MLRITRGAIKWLAENRARKGIPDTFGVRIADASSGPGIAVRSVAVPRQDEQTIETEGLRFFVSPATMGRLANRIIDVGDDRAASPLILRHAQRPEGKPTR